ncbi:MAG: hypothetical protein IKB02_06350 [Clostridia bacterium]|nr:hypothetical protein [Clostridia bacterium]
MTSRFSLSSNALKIIALISMTIDHIGLMFFPQYNIFRIIGRIALPIFSFMIAEGCRYTKNKLRYFLTVFLLGMVCQIAYGLYSDDIYLNILLTFSISILLVYALQNIKNAFFDTSERLITKAISVFVFILAVAAVYIVNLFIVIDYGFFGCVLPVFASIFHVPKNCESSKLTKLDNNLSSVLLLSFGMLLLTIASGINQAWCFLSLPFLLLYSGKRGKLRIKYFFYLYYPAHLLLLEAISLII